MNSIEDPSMQIRPRTAPGLVPARPRRSVGRRGLGCREPGLRPASGPHLAAGALGLAHPEISGLTIKLLAAVRCEAVVIETSGPERP